MANEEKFRTESTEEEDKPEEKRGLLRPLPTRETQTIVDTSGRPQPIVRLLGISMSEKRRDLLLLILMPVMIGLINSTICSYVITNALEESANILFFLPIFIAIPIGLTAADAGKALVGGFLGSLFFMIFLIIFLLSPGFYVPELGIGNFFMSALALTIGYYILILVSTLLGSVIGVILREFF